MSLAAPRGSVNAHPRYHRGVIQPPPRPVRASLSAPLILALLALALLAAACDRDATDLAITSATATPAPTRPVETSPVDPSASASPTTSPTAEATPHVVVTASPDEPVATTAYIPTSELPIARLTASDGTEHELPVEVPDRSEYSIGLSGRLELTDRGMLFWYREPTRQTFWMRNTHFDISVAFVGDDGRIVEILLLQAESLETRGPDQLYRFALEAPAGWYDERGIGPGDHAVLDFEIPDALRQ